MLKLGFFHDSLHVFDEGKYYSRTLSGVVWKRYLSVFDEVAVSTRVLNEPHGEMGLSEYEDVSFNPIKSYSGPRDLVSKFPKIIAEIESALDEVDCVIIRLPSIIGWIAVSLAKKKKKPVLIEVVGCPWDAYRFHSAAGKVLAPIGYLATRKALRSADFALYVTQDFLQKRYPCRGVSAGVSDVDISISDILLTRRIRKIDQKNTNRLLMGSIGRVDLSYKGHATAIRSLKKLRDEGLNIEYEIVGPGDPLNLQKLVQELGLQGAVKFMGPFSRNEVEEWLDKIDFYVQPSLTEGLPRSVVEAMSHALPVLVSNVGGQPELVGEDYIFQAGDALGLTGKIKDLLNDDWVKISSQNFEKSKDYEREALQVRRENLFRKFRESVSTRI